MRSYPPLPSQFTALIKGTAEERAVAVASMTPDQRQVAVSEALLGYAAISAQSNMALSEIQEELHAIRAELLAHLGRFAAVESAARMVAKEARAIAKVVTALTARVERLEAIGRAAKQPAPLANALRHRKIHR
jgi:hypothetical protein